MPDAVDRRIESEWHHAVDSARTPGIAAIKAASAGELASRTAILSELEDTRLLAAELRQSLESRGDEARRITSRWTIRDVVAHLASWARETRYEIETLRAGERCDEVIHFEREGGPRAWNQREIDARAGRTLGDLFDEFDRETNRVADIVAGVPEGDLRTAIEWPRTAGEPPVAWRLGLAPLLVKTCWHVRYHLTRIERARTPQR